MTHNSSFGHNTNSWLQMENVNSISISKLWKDILNILGLPIPKLGLHHESVSFSFPQYFQFISCLSLFLTFFFLCFAPTSPKVKVATSNIRSLELEVLWNLNFNLFMNNWKQCFPIFWKLKKSPWYSKHKKCQHA